VETLSESVARLISFALEISHDALVFLVVIAPKMQASLMEKYKGNVNAIPGH
jgi:hypothetical protein